MKINLCLLPKEDAEKPVNTGSTYVMKHKSDWVELPEEFAGNFVTVGYVKGVDFVYYKEKTYMILKSFIIPEQSTAVLLCKESVSGCDN